MAEMLMGHDHRPRGKSPLLPPGREQSTRGPAPPAAHERGSGILGQGSVAQLGEHLVPVRRDQNRRHIAACGPRPVGLG